MLRQVWRNFCREENFENFCWLPWTNYSRLNIVNLTRTLRVIDSFSPTHISRMTPLINRPLSLCFTAFTRKASHAKTHIPSYLIYFPWLSIHLFIVISSSLHSASDNFFIFLTSFEWEENKNIKQKRQKEIIRWPWRTFLFFLFSHSEGFSKGKWKLHEETFCSGKAKSVIENLLVYFSFFPLKL